MFGTSDDYVINFFVGLTILIFFFVYYYWNIVRPPVLVCRSTKFQTFLKESMPILSEKYWPTIWCYGSRCQTTLQYFCRVNFDIPYEREVLKMEDGGQVALDWLHLENENENTPIILILPGLMGNSAEAYVKRFVVGAPECNSRCVVYNYRGLGDLELKTPKLYCMTDTADLIQVIQHIRKRFPSAVLGACGTSMGAFMLAHYLINYSHQEKISVAMMINTLFDVFGAAEKMESGFDIYINKFMAYHLRQTVTRFKHILDTGNTPWDMTEVMKSKTIREFDDTFTSKMFGYNSVYEYYKDATLSDKMDKIRIPVLCLNAADDPGQPLEYGEDNDKPLFDNDQVAVMITAAGGHMSHLEGLWPFHKKTTYMHRVFVQYFSAMFKNDAYKKFLST